MRMGRDVCTKGSREGGGEGDKMTIQRVLEKLQINSLLLFPIWKLPSFSSPDDLSFTLSPINWQSFTTSASDWQFTVETSY